MLYFTKLNTYDFYNKKNRRSVCESYFIEAFSRILLNAYSSIKSKISNKNIISNSNISIRNEYFIESRCLSLKDYKDIIKDILE
jgi:hypothetical protein